MWRWIEVLLKMWRDTERKKEPKPEEPVTGARYAVRLKSYKKSPNRTHKGRRTTIKLSKALTDALGLTESNTRVEVDGSPFKFYAWDTDGGSRDMALYSPDLFPEDYAKPFTIRIYKDDVIRATGIVPEWDYTTVYVTTEHNKQENDSAS
jgi:hypothetical protein